METIKITMYDGAQTMFLTIENITKVYVILKRTNLYKLSIFSRQIIKLLLKDNVHDLYILERRTEKDLLKIKGFGPKKLEKVKKTMLQLGLYLKG